MKNGLNYIVITKVNLILWKVKQPIVKIHRCVAIKTEGFILEKHRLKNKLHCSDKIFVQCSLIYRQVVLMTNEELVVEYQNGNEKAFEELLNANKGIIGTMIKKWWNKVENGVVTRDELEAECIYAFFIAVAEYSLDRDCTFASYAFNRINWLLIRNLNKPTPKGSNGQTVSIVSISDVVPGTDGLTYADAIPDKDAEQELQDVLENLSRKSLKYRLIYFIDSVCTEREKEVLLQHYGIGCKQSSQQVIATYLGISDARVQQIETKAISKLRNSPLKYAIFSEYQFGINQPKTEHIKKLTKPNHNNISEKSYEDALKALGEL